MIFLRDILNFKNAQHPLVIIALIAVATMLTACSSEESPTDPGDTGGNGDPKFQVLSGTFDVTSRIIFDSCNSSESHDGSWDVMIDGGEFTFGDDYAGNWNSNVAAGIGETEREKYTQRFCTVTEWKEVNIEFTSADVFDGEIIYRRRVDGDCSTVCTTTWRIDGVRQDTTE